MGRHSFEPKIAAQVGLNAAVLYQNLTFWIEKNQANRRNLRDGRYWTYNSVTAFAELFPYLTEKQIRTALDKLSNAGLIVKGQFSDDRYDRTTWYALGDPICPDGQADLSEKAIDTTAPSGEPDALEGKTIRNRYKPDTNPYPPRDAGAMEQDLERVWLAYPADRRRGKTKCHQMIRDALTEISANHLFDAVRAYATESAGFTRSKVCFSDNWFRDRKWQRHLDDLDASDDLQAAAAAKLLAQTTAWVKTRSGMCRHLSVTQVNAAISAGLIERHEALEAGISV
ncbi:hypothetical protein [Pacificibacter sp. AS14]|uniref:hypothetical protein n=1 Tax=Pacificibacter sp. AS14 TaxID=3135785 RepID=UPI00317859C4